MFTFNTAISSAVETTDATSRAPATPATGPLAPEMLDRIHRYWQAANYLTIGQIYLQENPLLRESLRPEHIKPRLLGHWGTSPGLSLIYAHLNRLITAHDANVIFLAGPGHGGPAVIANVYLEGTYSAVYPDVSHDVAGMRRLFRRFSTPGGVPSHVSVPTPGSIHEGGELGYVLAHAFGAAFDNPDLIVAAVVGDGEAETGPLSGSWKSVKYLNAARDGAVLPILHLNGYKIAGPTALGRSSSKGLTPSTCIRRSLLRLINATRGYAAFRVMRAQMGTSRMRSGRQSWSGRQKDGQVRAKSTGYQWKGRFARTRYRWPMCETTRHISRCSSSGCAAITQKICSMQTAA